MSEDPQPQPISKHPVLQQIDEHKIKMRSRSYFTSRTIIVIVFTLALFAVAVFLSSFVVYLFGHTDLFLLAKTDRVGFQLFIAFFPWFTIICALVIIYIIGALLSRYAFIYLRPAFIAAILILMILGLGSIFLQTISFHDNFGKYAISNNVPLLDIFYQKFQSSENEHVFSGEVLSVSSANLKVRGVLGDVWEPSITPKTIFYAPIHAGEQVTVIVHGRGSAQVADYIRPSAK